MGRYLSLWEDRISMPLQSLCAMVNSGRGEMQQTFANFDLDTGVALGDIFDASHYLGHLVGIAYGRRPKVEGRGSNDCRYVDSRTS
jgi:hypothetical protein